ncbi:aldo/keto reductase [Ectobacillus sp. JY-23]|uniref:aldo/keto reductase n=1 Tax=Ectobacillus sp. JY-23 TaxID=2933872 RepID=UPI001FF4BB25|nr:aldo/keto reductase [Ectobacillus sp. JY-23]UOY91102.1 aldo/keto reductase [Ectobacillus sp. JY-23]
MEQIQLAENVKFSRIVHGLWRLTEWNMTDAEVVQLIEQCMELGITTFDHADIYGDYTCETLFGQALRQKPSLRENMQIVTKCGIKLLSDKYPERTVKYYDTSKEHIIKSVEQSLRNLQTEYIDVLLIHRPDPFMNPAEVAEAFRQLRQEGKVLQFGVSNFLPSQFDMLSAHVDEPLVTNQIEISALQLEHFGNGTLDKCQETRIAPMAWSPLAGGSIFRDSSERAERVRSVLEKIGTEIGATSLDEVLYAWLLQHPARIMPIVGSGKLERIQSAVNATKLSMTTHQWFEIYTASMGHEVP